MTRRSLPLPLVLAALVLAAAGARAQAPLTPPRNDTVDVVLTVSGGISLGSYESGANWALVETLRLSRDSAFQTRNGIGPHRLVVATGASAGNINALLSALHWCDSGQGSSQAAEESLFWQLWVSTGIDQLFPNDAGTRGVPRFRRLGDRPRYGIFRRDSLQLQHYPQIRARVNAAYPDPCDVTLGIMLTKIEPDSIALNERLFPRAQRFASIFQLRTYDGPEGGRLRIEPTPDEMRSDTALGMLVLPPTESGGTIHIDTLLKIVEASSAFPLAFEPVRLRYYPSPSSSCAHEQGCERMKKSLFIDGGVFDNNPLGLGLRMYRDLRPPKAGTQPAATHELYVYIDPDGTRSDSAAEPAWRRSSQMDGAGLGLSSISALLGGAVPAARDYELHALARNLTGDMRRGRIATTDRRHRLVSSHLGAFAGFLGRPFREYDFYVGVYDGLYFAARSILCKPTEDAAGECVQARLAQLLTDSAFQLTPTAQLILGRLYREEFQRPLPGVDERPATRRAAVLLAVDEALDSTRHTPPCDAGSPVSRALCRDGFVRFVHHLSDAIPRTTSHLPRESGCESPFACSIDRPMKSLMDDPERYLARLASRVIDRMDNVERGLRHAGNHRGVVLAGALYHMGAGEPRRGIEKDPSSVPDTRGTWWRTTAHVLPYYVGFGTNTRMLETGFRPGFYFRRGSALMVPLLPLHLAEGRAGGGRRAYLGYGGGVHADVPGPLAVEASYQQLRPWGHLRKAAPVNSVDGAVIFGEKVRLGVRLVTSDRSRQYTRRTAVSLGILDLNGLIYWAGRIAH